MVRMWEAHAKVDALHWYDIVDEEAGRTERSRGVEDPCPARAKVVRLVAFLCKRSTLMGGVALAPVSFALTFTFGLPWLTNVFSCVCSPFVHFFLVFRALSVFIATFCYGILLQFDGSAVYTVPTGLRDLANVS